MILDKLELLKKRPELAVEPSAVKRLRSCRLSDLQALHFFSLQFGHEEIYSRAFL